MFDNFSWSFIKFNTSDSLQILNPLQILCKLKGVQVGKGSLAYTSDHIVSHFQGSNSTRGEICQFPWKCKWFSPSTLSLLPPGSSVGIALAYSARGPTLHFSPSYYNLVASVSLGSGGLATVVHIKSIRGNLGWDFS